MASSQSIFPNARHFLVQGSQFNAVGRDMYRRTMTQTYTNCTVYIINGNNHQFVFQRSNSQESLESTAPPPPNESQDDDSVQPPLGRTFSAYFPDLTDQVDIENLQHAGKYNDIYIGKLKSDYQKVALRGPKSLFDTIDEFFNEIYLWGIFDHPNVLPFYGIVYLEKDTGLFAVSPWMINGTAIEYVRKHPDADVPKMLAEITEGLAYLHSRQILHGDVRGVNVLISGDCVARLSDFRLSRRLDCNEDLPYPPINPPWSPPEFSSYEKPPMLTKQSDIWSLGITFLELLVDELPFREMAHGVWHAYKGTVSERPKSLAAIQSRISNEMRSLLERCWEKPESRDRIEDVQDALNLIRERPTAIYNEEALVVPTFIESIPEDTVRLDPSRPPKLQLELDHKYSSRHVYVGSSGAVVAGTLEGLIDRLVDNIDLRKDNIFREAILMASVDFASPKDVAAKMWEQFNEAEQDKQQRSEARMATQYNVLKVMSYWLRRRQLPVDAELLWEMREFCMATLKMKSSPTLVEKIHNLLELIEIRPKQDAVSRPKLSPRRRLLTSKDILPHSLALALTLLEGEKFKQITPSDYLAHLCGRREYTNVEAAATANKKILIWVQRCLVHYEALYSRVDVMTFFINTANECRKLRNYQSFVAIALALSSPPVQSLGMTRQFLKKPVASQLEGLVKLCSADGNHSRYREALKEVIDPTYRDYCIPWIDVHLEELRSILRANGRIVEIKGQPLINIQRYTEFLNRVKELFSLPPPDLERYRHQGQLAYLEAQLADVQIGEVADRELEEKAQSLKAIEDVLISQRVIGLIRCGHRIPQELRRYVFVTG